MSIPPAQSVGGAGVTPVPKRVPGFLLEPSLRLYCLRAVILLGTIDTWFLIWLYRNNLSNAVLSLVAAIVVIFTVLHHFVTAIGPHLIPVPVWADLALTILETVYDIVFSTYLALWTGNGSDFKWFPKREAFGYVMFFGLTIFLILLSTLKIAQQASSPRGATGRKVELGHLGHLGHGDPAWWKYGAQALFGRKPWEQKLPGEPRSILLTRGVLTLCIVVMLTIFATNEVVLKPVAEMGMTPNREFRAQAIEGGFKTSTSVLWNLVLIWPMHGTATARLIDSTDVQVLPSGDLQETSACKGTERPDLAKSFGYSNCEIVVFECARPVPGREGEDIRDLRNGTDRSYLSNLLLSIDFLELLGERLPSNNQDIMTEALQVFIGLTEDVFDVTRTTRSIPLFPGINLLSVANLILRQRLRPAALSTLGFDMYNTFFVADVKYTIPNPYIEDHQNTTDRLLSTLRVVPEWGMREWVVVQDYRSKSVLTGLSAVGGLGSLLGTLLIIILGTSLMRTLRGSKPYSPFGILHNMGDGRDRIREECMRRYPAMRAELEAYQSASSRSQVGVTAFLLDTLFDSQALGFQGVPERGSPESEKVDTLITPTQAQSSEEQSGPLRLSYNPYTQA